MSVSAEIVSQVTSLLGEVLGIPERAETMNANTPLLGSLPELDSMAVLEVVQSLEERFGIPMDDAEITAEDFETVASLAGFVEAHLS